MATKATGSPPVWRVAALSRVAMLLLMLTFDALVDDYDTSGRLSPGDGVSSAKTSGDAERPPNTLCAAVEGLVTWDAVYFLRIAEVGYEHEQTHAFFPLLPAVTRGVAATSSALAEAIPRRGSDSKTMWSRVRRRFAQTPSRCASAASAVAVSNAAHVLAAVILERLGNLVLAEQRIGRDSLLHEVDHSAAHSEAARAAAVLFALNPASVFHSAAYTESVFALFSFAGFFLLERARLAGTATATKKSESAFWKRNGAAVLFALACATRSNGALNGLVLAHDFFFASAAPFWKERTKKKRKVFFFIAATSAFAARCVATLFPLFAVQLYGYRTYCVDGFIEDSKPAWCDVWRPFPNVYAHVQSHYWNVGFLRYYESKQIPNFLLAAPALFVSANAGLSWWNAFLGRARFGNARDESAKRSSDDEAGEADEARANRTRSGSSVSRRRREGRSLRLGGEKKTKNLSRDFARGNADVDEDAWMLSPRVRPYLFKWAVMSAVALLAMHVQVTTRFLSVTPGVYWFLAKKGFAEAERERLFARKLKSAAGHEKKTRTFWRRGVTTYSTSFFLLGALLFPTFYPWT